MGPQSTFHSVSSVAHDDRYADDAKTGELLDELHRSCQENINGLNRAMSEAIKETDKILASLSPSCCEKSSPPWSSLLAGGLFQCHYHFLEGPSTPYIISRLPRVDY